MDKTKLNKMSALLFRIKVRNGELKRTPTILACKGYKQANLAILPKQQAVYFEEFAKRNNGAIPLLYTSKVGEFAAPPLCEDSDIRTDVPSYNKVANGQVVCSVDDLLGFDLSDFVTFYIGCSFSFTDILVSNKIIMEPGENKNVSMYKSNIDCYKSGPFNCKMIVSMRAIQESKLSLTDTVCQPLMDVHGAPIHYGNPKLIGIEDVAEYDEGDSTEFTNGDVPVFWCCGVTGMQALKSANINLCFTHTPGHMFITDLPQAEDPINYSNLKSVSEVVKYNIQSNVYSTMSKAASNVLDSLNSIATEDPGQRGIDSLVVPGDFTKAALALSHASSVALLTGFPIHIDCNPPDETDGLPGIISLAAALQSLGKQVSLIVDDYGVQLNEEIIKKCVQEGLLKEAIEIIPYVEGETHFLDRNGKILFDAILASERIGRSIDGRYYSMKGKDLSSRVNHVDNLFDDATKHSDVITIAIGDGGNELGMGKAHHQVSNCVPLGEKIACVVPANHLVAAGTSNWGCYALGLALFVLRCCPFHERYVRRAVGFPINAYGVMKNFLPSVQRERRILEVVESFGIRDGVSPQQAMSVDGMFFEDEHSNILKRLAETAGLD